MHSHLSLSCEKQEVVCHETCLSKRKQLDYRKGTSISCAFTNLNFSKTKKMPKTDVHKYTYQGESSWKTRSNIRRREDSATDRKCIWQPFNVGEVFSP